MEYLESPGVMARAFSYDWSAPLRKVASAAAFRVGLFFERPVASSNCSRTARHLSQFSD